MQMVTDGNDARPESRRSNPLKVEVRLSRGLAVVRSASGSILGFGLPASGRVGAS